jgi:O-antigen/teichoic acid export membrane protein
LFRSRAHNETNIGGAKHLDAQKEVPREGSHSPETLLQQPLPEVSKNLETDLTQLQCPSSGEGTHVPLPDLSYEQKRSGDSEQLLDETPPSLETPAVTVRGLPRYQRENRNRRRNRAFHFRIHLEPAAQEEISIMDTEPIPSTNPEELKSQQTRIINESITEDITLQDTLQLPLKMLVEKKQAQSDQRQVITSTAGNAAIAGAGDLFSAILKFVTNIVMTNTFSQSVYGIFISVLAAATIVGTIMVFGLDYMLIRFLSIYRTRNERSLAAGLLRFTVWTTIISGLISGVLFYSSATIFAHLVYHQNAYTLPLREVALLIPLIALQPVLAGGLMAMKRIKWKVYTDRLIQPAVSLILMGVFYFLGLRLEALILATICGYLASIIVGKVLLSRATKHLIRDVIPAFAPKTWLHFVLPMSFYSIVQNILENTDVLFLAAFASPAQVGLYAAADRVSFVVLMPLGAFITIFAPLIAEYYARGEHEQLVSLAKIVTKWAFSLSLPLFLCLSIFHEAILSIFSSEYTAASAALIILSLANLIDVSVGPIGDLLLMTGHTRMILANTVVAITVNIGLSFLLIPRFNIIGAAIASGVALVIPNLAGLFEVYLILKIPVFRGDMLKPALAGGVASIVGLLLLPFVPVSSGYRAIFGILGLVIPFMLVYAVMLAVLRFSDEDRMVFDALRSRFRRKQSVERSEVD